MGRRYGGAVDVKRAADLYAQGRTLRQIGAELGVTATTVSHQLRRAGVTMRRGGPPAPTRTPSASSSAAPATTGTNSQTTRRQLHSNGYWYLPADAGTVTAQVLVTADGQSRFQGWVLCGCCSLVGRRS